METNSFLIREPVSLSCCAVLLDLAAFAVALIVPGHRGHQWNTVYNDVQCCQQLAACCACHQAPAGRQAATSWLAGCRAMMLSA